MIPLYGLLEELRFGDIVGIGTVHEQAAAILNGADDLFMKTYRQRGATQATADISLPAAKPLIYIFRCMHHDRSFHGVAVDAILFSFQAQRETVLPSVSSAGNIKTKAAFKALGRIGKAGRHFLTGVTAVGHKGIEQQLTC